jgi:hypothetical protein
VLALVSVALGALLVLRIGEPPRVIAVREMQPAPAPLPPRQPAKDMAAPHPVQMTIPTPSDLATWEKIPTGYLRARDEMLRWGVNLAPWPQLPSSTSRPRHPMSAHDLLEWFPECSIRQSGGPL